MTPKRIVRGLLLIPTTLVLLVMRMVRPLVEFQLMIVAFHRFGHLALEPEVFLSRLSAEDSEASPRRRRPIVVRLWSLGPTKAQSNQFLAKMWKEVLFVPSSWCIDALLRAGDKFPFLQLLTPKLSVHGPANALDNSLPHLTFSNEERRSGLAGLEGLGLDCNQPFVCLIVRDRGHYKSLGEIESPNMEMFNFDIDDFEMAAVALVARGYQVVRMGAGAEKPLSKQIVGVFDYSLSNHRSEFLDIYLAASCKFALSTQTGPDAVCLAFRRPVCYIDVTRFSQFFFGTKIAYWSPAKISLDGRTLRLKEVVSGDLPWLKSPDDFRRVGLEGAHSTPNEILKLANCFTDLFEGGMVMAGDDLAMSIAAQEIISVGLGQRGNDAFGRITAQINPAFLREHGEWFLS